MCIAGDLREKRGLITFGIIIKMNLNNKEVPIIAFVGRPNVGKSTLFNWIARRKLAIVNDKPGSTRDRKYALVNFAGLQYRLVDTGGLLNSFSGEIYQKVVQQTRFAIGEADLVVFIVDVKDGLLPSDMEIAAELRRAKVLVVLAVNKCDSRNLEYQAYEFYSLIKAPLVMISAAQGLGITSLFSKIELLIPNLFRKEELEKLEKESFDVFG